ncbi:phage head protein [Comamonas thiooxydans]|uniref:Phage head protein n=1 Tax=Comamonas thiooxydans TaxID=363952 RepID=A0A0E3CGK5_9BURK|nr:head completion/stabilization protein [Comamonas thiooxydans]KGH10202.1 hypothetical protein P607_26610 [Comamonas thiooxydans]KGH12154.1 phage head protein [Comamonas thiooxydans]
MNGFVVTANPPAKTEEPVVTNDGWFPDMDPAKVRDACRLDGTVTTARLRPALVDAMLSVNDELQLFKASSIEAGHTKLADVPASMVDGKSAKVQQYMRAVHYCLMADLAEAYRNMASLPDGSGKAGHVLERLVVEVDEHRRKQRWAIADLKGGRRSIVELI